MMNLQNTRGWSTAPQAALWPALVLALLVCMSPAQAQTEAANACGPVITPGHYGPYDYRYDRKRLEIVEVAHFTPPVEAGTRGSTGDLGLDLSYTLKASPNHHRALMSIVRIGARDKSPQPVNLAYSIDCFFDRAVRFASNDNIVRMIYAQYLGQQGRAPDAKLQLDVVIKSAGDNPLTFHNVGLVLYEMGDFDAALVQAHQARKLGFERSRLETLLRQNGKWKDPVE
jgi:hypothetical protein